MKLHLISSVVLVAIIAIGTLEALPNVFPIPKTGEIGDEVFTSALPGPAFRYPYSLQENENNADIELIKLSESAGIEHVVAKRTPERIVINYTPPPQNGPRHARSVEKSCCG